MKKQLHRWLLLISLTASLAKDGELPLCPSNMQYFPQNLPMHCRLPKPGEFQLGPEMSQMPTMPPLTQFLQNMRSDKQQGPLPMPGPPFPGMPGQMPMPMPMPMMPGVPPHKLPVIVMPFYSPDPSAKRPGSRRPGSKGKKKKPFFKKPPRYDSDTDSRSDTDTDTETDTSSDTSDTSDSSSERGWWKGQKRAPRMNARRHNLKHKLKRRIKKRKELLTPILQYVTKDGYVIFEKKITKNEAKDWLRPKKDNIIEAENVADDNNDNENHTDNRDNMEQGDPKPDAEELELKEKEKEKSNEEKMESSPQKKKKHRQRKPNTLINQPVKPSP